jgi:hypothetical protein
MLAKEKIEELLSSARGTVGVRMNESARQPGRQYAQEELRCREEQKKVERALARLSAGNEVIQAQAQAVGLM